jgi:hypothetical protein
MNESLVIDEFVLFGRLDFAVQHQGTPVVSEFDDFDVLIRAVFGEEDRFDAVEVGLVRS